MATKDITDRQVCEAYQQCVMARNPGNLSVEWPYDVLRRTTGQPFKVCYRAMERADQRGLVEYGVSLRSGWLTEKGQELLKGKLIV